MKIVHADTIWRECRIIPVIKPNFKGFIIPLASMRITTYASHEQTQHLMNHEYNRLEFDYVR